MHYSQCKQQQAAAGQANRAGGSVASYQTHLLATRREEPVLPLWAPFPPPYFTLSARTRTCASRGWSIWCSIASHLTTLLPQGGAKGIVGADFVTHPCCKCASLSTSDSCRVTAFKEVQRPPAVIGGSSVAAKQHGPVQDGCCAAGCSAGRIDGANSNCKPKAAPHCPQRSSV